MKLDYRSMIYAAICTTPWRYADLAVIERRLLRRGALGHMRVQELHVEAIIAAQAQFEPTSSSVDMQIGASL